MQTVYKYQLSMTQDAWVSMPSDARIVHVGLDGFAKPCIWALVNPDDLPTQRRQFGVFGTGGRVPDFWEYVGTFIDLPLVWHVFENPAS